MDKFFMEEALKEAKKAFEENEIPVGAVVVFEGRIVAKGRNNRNMEQDIAGHAELMALRTAGKVLGLHKLVKASIYTTLEPCPMCLGAIIQSRIKNLYFGAYDKKLGAVESFMKYKEFPDSSKTNIQGGILEIEASNLLKEFFIKMRNK